MQFKKKVIYSGIVSAIALAASIFTPIIPCRTAPYVPNPVYKWGLCDLNPDTIKGLGHIREYFGYTSSLSDAYIITLLIAFAASMIFFHYVTRRTIKE